MGRKSTTCGVCRRKKYRRALLVYAALLAVTLLVTACAPKECPEPETRIIYREKPDDIAILASKLEDTEISIEALKALMSVSASQCRASFYLCVLDGARKEYVHVLYSDKCLQEVPAEVKVIKNLVYWEKRARKCIRQQEGTAQDLETCREENEMLEKELLRIKFEYKKMEEIRKEAEKWRMN